MSIYGVVPTGFRRKTADEIREDFQNKYKTAFGNDFDVSDDSPEGVEIGIFTELLSNAHEILEAVYYAPLPDYAEKISLDNASSASGVSRLGPKKSVVTQVELSTLGASDVIVPIGTVLKQSFNNIEWVTTQAVTIPASGSIIVPVESVDFGVFSASIGSIDDAVTVISGLDVVSNLTISIEGRLIETDAEFRKRRAISLVISKGGTLQAVINAVKKLDGVTYCSGIENRTSAIVDGLPPHSFSLTVEGGIDLEIATTIKETKGDGIETHGGVSTIITDIDGNSNTIRFNRATIKDVYLIVNLTTNSLYPSNGDILAKTLINELANNYKNGDDVINWRLMGILDAIIGIDDVEILQSFSPSPTLSTNLTVLNTERARILTTNIIVNS